MKPIGEFDDRYKPLLARRIRREDIVLGRGYVIHARNGVGVAVTEGGQIGYRSPDHGAACRIDLANTWKKGPRGAPPHHATTLVLRAKPGSMFSPLKGTKRSNSGAISSITCSPR